MGAVKITMPMFGARSGHERGLSLVTGTNEQWLSPQLGSEDLITLFRTRTLLFLFPVGTKPQETRRRPREVFNRSIYFKFFARFQPEQTIDCKSCVARQKARIIAQHRYRDFEWIVEDKDRHRAHGPREKIAHGAKIGRLWFGHGRGRGEQITRRRQEQYGDREPLMVLKWHSRARPSVRATCTLF